MKLSPTITLQEMAAILREHLSHKFDCEIVNIVVESHNKPVIDIEADGMVTALEFRHKADK